MYVSRCPGCGVETVLTGHGCCQDCQNRRVVARTAAAQMAHQQALASRMRSEQEELEQARRTEEEQRFVRQALHEIASQEVGNPERTVARLAVFLATEEYQRHPDLVEETVRRLGLSSEYETALVSHLGRASAPEVRTTLNRLIERNPRLYDQVMADPQFCGREDYGYFSGHRGEYLLEQQRQSDELEKALTEAENERRVAEFHRRGKPLAAIGAWVIVWGAIASVAWFAPSPAARGINDEDAAAGARVWMFMVAPFFSILLCVVFRRLISWTWRALAVLLFAFKLTKEDRSREKQSQQLLR